MVASAQARLAASRPDLQHEPVDTKLARTAKPAHVLQLMFYAEQVARISGRPVEEVQRRVRPAAITHTLDAP